MTYLSCEVKSRLEWMLKFEEHTNRSHPYLMCVCSLACTEWHNMHVHFTSKVRTFMGRKELLTPLEGCLMRFVGSGFGKALGGKGGGGVHNVNKSPHKNRSTSVYIRKCLVMVPLVSINQHCSRRWDGGRQTLFEAAQEWLYHVTDRRKLSL